MWQKIVISHIYMYIWLYILYTAVWKELAAFLADVAGPVNLVMDLRIAQNTRILC